MGTLDHEPAGSAGDRAREAPAVEKKHGLLPPRQTVPDQAVQGPGQYAPVASAQFHPHIRNFRTGQASACQPFIQGKQPVLSAQGPVIRLHGWRRAAQDHTGAPHAGDLNGRFPGVVFGHGFILITVLVFFVHHDNAQTLEGSKEGGTGADNDIDLTPSGPLPLVCLLALRQRRINDRDPVSEMSVKAEQGLVGQGNLGNQHDGLSSRPADPADDGNIDLGLAAAGNAPDQGHAGSSGFKGFHDLVRDPLLGRAQGLLPPGIRAYTDRIAQVCIGFHLDHAGLLHGPYDRSAHMEPGRDQVIGLDRRPDQFPQQTFPGHLMFPVVKSQLFLRGGPVQQQADLPPDFGAACLPGGQDRLQGCDRRSAVPILHPGGQPDIKTAVLFPAVALPGQQDLPDLPDLIFRQVTVVRQLDHISRPDRMAEGDPDPAARFHLIRQSVRDPIGERPVQLLMGDIYDDLGISILSVCHILLFLKFDCFGQLGTIPYCPAFAASSARMSRIRSLSSMGYLTPLIS